MKILTQGNYAGKTRSQYKIPGLIFTKCFFSKAFNSDWHSHENSHLTFALKGGSIERRKKGSTSCSPGLLLFYPANELHRNTDYVSNSESFSIEFENEWCKNLEINNQEKNRQHIIRNPLVKLNMITIMREIKEADDLSNLCLETTILGILSSLGHDETGNKRPSWITQLYELLHDECNNNWRLASLSEKLKVHPVTISKYFPKYFQSNIGDYVRKIKTARSLTDLCKKS